MNQILSTELKKESKKLDEKTVILVFAICIILFGICLTSGSVYAYHQNQVAKENARQFEQIVEPANSITIALEPQDNKVKATVSGDNIISFITYKWDDQEETREDMNAAFGNVEINIPEGLHTLTIIAVDVNNNTETITKEVKGVKKPELKVIQDGKYFIVRASDEKGLDKFEIILNGKGYLVKAEGVTEKKFKYPLEEGENELQVKVYNTDGATEVFEALCEN